MSQIELAAQHLENYTIKSIPKQEVIYSPHGHVIDEDGNVYALVKRWWHGVVMVLLDVADNPEINIPEKVDSFDLFELQTYKPKKAYIRVANGPLYGLYVTLPEVAISQTQLESLTAVLATFNEELDSSAFTEYGETSVRRILKMAVVPKDDRFQIFKPHNGE